MFYKSPGRALQDLLGISTGRYGKKVVHYKKNGIKFLHVHLSFVSFVFDLKNILFKNG
jgi:hypothetical protein